MPSGSYAVWSPDDQRIAVALCSGNRYRSGSTGDPICWIELFDTTTGVSRGTFEPGFAPSWAADGSKFATVRKIDGFHRDANGTMVSHYAIMLFNGNELIGRQILLADQGSEPSYLTWSPDGTFLLYTLFLGGGADIWWLDTRTGATGRLTTNGHSAAASRRLHCPTPNCQDSANVYLPYIQR